MLHRSGVFANCEFPLGTRARSRSTENQRLLKAEALRELGLFTEAKQVLSRSFSDGMAPSAATIRDLVERDNRTVREMTSS